MKSSAGKIQVTSFQDLFQTGGGTEADDRTLREIPLSELFPFKNHPFQVRDDEAMQKTVESIARSGVITPGIVRPRSEGGYEIIAGHRRKRGSELAGKETKTQCGILIFLIAIIAVYFLFLLWCIVGFGHNMPPSEPTPIPRLG